MSRSRTGTDLSRNQTGTWLPRSRVRTGSWPGQSRAEPPPEVAAAPVAGQTAAAPLVGLVEEFRQVDRQTEKPETAVPAVRFVRLAPPTTADDIPLVVRRARVETGAPAGAPGDVDSAAGRAPIALTNAPPVATHTPPPLLVPHHGVMTDTAGVPLAGRISTIFSVYQEQAGGIPFWVSLKAVETDVDGRYLVMLGETATLPDDLLETATPPWLGVQPDGLDEQPRVRLAGVPCALPGQGVGPPARLPTTTLLRLPEIRPVSTTARGADMPCPRPAPMVHFRATSTAAPSPIPYRGVLNDTTGVPLVDLVSAIFAFYEEAAGGIPLWVDIQTLDTGAAGGYTVLLGGTTALPADLFTTGARWLGVQADGQAEQPRVEFAAPALFR